MKSLEIYNLLPKTNCGECGLPTCLAFAMKLAAKKAEPKSCPYLSKEAKTVLEEKSKAPIKEIEFGKIKMGGETVMYRHEKRFFNPAPIAVLIHDNINQEQIQEKINFINSLKLDRMGEVLSPEILALSVTDFEKSKNILEQMQSLDKEILYIGDIELINSLLPIRKGIIYHTKEELSRAAEIAKQNQVPIVVSGTVEELKEKTKNLQSENFEDIILNLAENDIKKWTNSMIKMRRSAVVDGDKLLGYPVINFPKNLEQASFAVAKYCSLIVLEDFSKPEIAAIMTLRQNIYTDPQKPIQVESGIYEINNPDQNSIILITSNFSLTFFSVKSDLENSKKPAYLLVIDTEGLSVLTAWAADKLNAEIIAKTAEKFKINEKTNSKKIIIPGLVAMISGELEEKTGCQVLVGPKDSSAIGTFLKNLGNKS
jgi:acetyl-CoA decarbonylase/synthase complex subunit gamma